MLFNSLEFLIFLPIVFLAYWALKKHLNVQNFFLLVASFVFYGWWDWRFLILLCISSSFDFWSSIQIYNSSRKSTKKKYLGLSLLVNLGLLMYFKYFNFFISSAEELLISLGFRVNVGSLNVILPVGISFYTFQALSYTIDVYRGKLEPTRNPVSFFAFVSFFPQLVAGPIERAIYMLPQFSRNRIFSYSNCTEGLKQIAWGLFKKIVVADNCAEYVQIIFNHHGDFSGSTLWLGAFFFAFQIYGDFSGYSDIAIGTARLLGFDLMRNFAWPYFSRDVAEFWRRWHISLSTWFRDYVYIPLGGSKGSMAKTVRNTFIVFFISGFWHGANWTYVIWGLLNALYIMPLVIWKSKPDHNIVASGKILPGIKDLGKLIFTFLLISLAWVFFRSDSVGMAFDYIKHMFSASVFSIPEVRPKVIFMILACFIVMEWMGRENNFTISGFFSRSTFMKWTFYVVLTMSVILFYSKPKEFIYFQF